VIAVLPALTKRCSQYLRALRLSRYLRSNTSRHHLSPYYVMSPLALWARLSTIISLKIGTILC